MKKDTLYCEMSDIAFRKSDVNVPYLFYKDKYGEEYTTTEIDRINQLLIQNAYREKNSIPFTDEIKNLRKRYGLSAKKMSRLLGFGENQYRIYEEGEMPSLSNAKMISGTEDINFVERLIDEAGDIFSEKELAKLHKCLCELKSNLGKENSTLYKSYPRTKSRYNGYVSVDLKKLENFIIFFTEKLGGVFETKLNKLLFYSDFIHYKLFARGISGLRYRAIQYGPVPVNYGTLYESFGALRKDIVEIPGGYTGSVIYADREFDRSLFSDDEMETMEKVLTFFKSATSKDISSKSHQEEAWIKNESTRAIIDYSDAFTLRLDV